MSAGEAQIAVNTNLQRQDLSNLDISNLTALSPEVISRQATINIGTIGHVAHGKSTVVKAISGVQTVRFKNELERNITIKLVRISQKRIINLLRSPKLLRAYEADEKRRLQQLAYERKQRKQRSISVDTQCTTQSCNYGRQQMCRELTISPSSGYESYNDNTSTYSGDFYSPNSFGIKRSPSTPLSYKLTQQRLQQKSFKRPLDQLCESTQPKSKKRKSIYATGEYVIEHIESLESINAEPVFFVKWLNYPAEANTWESLENLIEVEQLEEFVEERYALFEVVINRILSDLEAEIVRDSLSCDMIKLNLRDLNNYEPLRLKVDLILLAHFREARCRSQREPEIIRKRAINTVLLKPLYYQRKQQLVALKAFETAMNTIESIAPIAVENNVDFDVPDTEFQYIKESFAGPNVEILEDPPIGCKCVECVPMARCCARMADSYFAYDKNSRLRIKPGGAIFECNNLCACDSQCKNRIIQQGRSNRLCLFKTSNGCGWGVRTQTTLRKGEFVCEYVGEIITSEEANIRGAKYDAIGRTYLFDLDYNTSMDSVYTIDAAAYGNISHFINHSCDPNLAVFPFWINNLDVNMPRLAFFTLRQIPANEELTFDYIRTDADDYSNLSEAEKVTCRCGAENCRKVLF